MATNRPRVIPALSYEDPAAALDWLDKAFGFETSMCITGPDGDIMHAEMEFADATIMVGPAGWADWARSPKAVGGANTQTLHVQIDDVDGHCARSKAAGAMVEMEPRDEFYGDRVYAVHDCEGHRWVFHQHVRDIAPQDWGLPEGSTVQMRD